MLFPYSVTLRLSFTMENFVSGMSWNSPIWPPCVSAMLTLSKSIDSPRCLPNPGSGRENCLKMYRLFFLYRIPLPYFGPSWHCAHSDSPLAPALPQLYLRGKAEEHLEATSSLAHAEALRSCDHPE